MNKFIVTFTPHFKKSLLKELISVDSSIFIEEEIDESIICINTTLKKEEFTIKLFNKSPIFVKHIMPVDKEINITLFKDKDLEILKKELDEIALINKDTKFAVQCRIIGSRNEGIEYTSKDVEVSIGRKYEEIGGIPVFSDANLKNEDIQVISILINKNKVYMGFSSSKDNLNFHSDEYRICSKTGREISRADNKLKEALIKFDIKLSGEGYALDIGAAPGGWTKVLADYGYSVIAVDPGNLKEELYNNPKIKHHKCRIEDLKFDHYFDIIVNDMNVDPEISASIMNSLSNSLKDKGLAIVTFKLPGKVDEAILESSKILSSNYEVLSIKSLFHNRQEVTVLLRKKQ